MVVSVCIPALFFRKLLATSLALSTDGCVRRPDGSYLYAGKRPDEGDWHGHGYFERMLWVLGEKELERVRLLKHRWRLVGTNKTCHSRPLEDSPSFGSSLAIVMLVVFTWLDSDKGLNHRDRRSPIADIEERCASRRTSQRWLHKFLLDSLNIEQAIRRAVIERCEPRPVEKVFRGGLSPPDGLERRGWSDPPSVTILWRALAMLFLGALDLDVPVSTLLTEARGRWNDQKTESGF